MPPHYFRRERAKHKRPILISDYLLGKTLEFYVAGNVFSSQQVDEGTKLLLENIIIEDGVTVLDAGCGYGVIGIAIAKAYPKTRVYMVDINPEAVKLAKMNAKRNKVEDRVIVLQGDLYEPVQNKKFNAIISNPPLSAGWKTIERLIRGAPQHLTPYGYLETVFKKGGEKAKKIMKEAGLEIVRDIRRKGYNIIIARKSISPIL